MVCLTGARHHQRFYDNWSTLFQSALLSDSEWNRAGNCAKRYPTDRESSHMATVPTGVYYSQPGRIFLDFEVRPSHPKAAPTVLGSTAHPDRPKVAAMNQGAYLNQC